MSSDSDDRASSAGGALRFVTCELSSLSECRCSISAAGSGSGSSSSSKRKAPSCKRPPAPTDLSPATVKRVLLPPAPTVIDRLLSESRTALMEGRRNTRSAVPTPPPAPTRGRPRIHFRQQQHQQLGKRKNQDKLDNGTSPVVKRLKHASKTGSESDSSPSRNGSTERKSVKTVEKTKKTQIIDKNLTNKTNLEGKSLPVIKKVIRKHGKSRFSKRICFSTSSLRSGKKRTELLNKKRIVKGLAKDAKEKRKQHANDKMDSNSNVCTENDSNDETVDNSTDSEVSRGPSDFPDSKDSDINQQDLDKKKRKRRKRDSMWVKKVKKQLKVRSEIQEKSLPPPALEPFNEIVHKKESEASEELPILDKESDDSLNIDFGMGNSSINMAVQDDVPMPMLEKEVEITVASKAKTIDSDLPLKEDSLNKTTQENLVSNDTSSSCKENIPNNSDKYKLSKLSSIDIIPDLSPTITNEHTKLISPNEKDELPQLVALPEGEHSIVCSQAENKKHTDLESSVKNNQTEPYISCIDNKNEPHLSGPDEQNELTLSDIKDQTEPIPPKVNLPNELSSSEEFKPSEICLLDKDKPNELFLTLNNLLPEVSCPENNEPKKSLTGNNIDLSCSTQDVPGINEIDHVNETKVSEHSADSLPCNECKLLEEEDQKKVHIKDLCDKKSDNITKPDESLDFNIPVANLLKLNDVKVELSSQDIPNDNTEQSQANTLGINDCNIDINSIQPKENNENSYHENPSSPQVAGELSIVKDKFVSSAQNLEDEITKLEAVLSGSSDTESKYEESITSKDTNIETQDIKCSDKQIKAELVTPETLCASPDKKFVSNSDLKDVSLLDADSTSDMKPQNLDDSFSDFSLCLPDDLELESSPSDDDREENVVLPDSTDCEKSEEHHKEENLSYEVGIPEEPQFTEMSSNLKEEAPSEVTIEREIRNDNMCKIEVMETSEIDISETTILKQEFPEAPLDDVKPLAGSTPRRTSTETENEQRPIEIIKKEVLTVEQRQMKESVLQALGLKSLSSSPQPPPEEKPKRDGYTGTLKAVIKLNRSGDKKNMVYKRSEDSIGAKLEYRICSEIPATEGVPITHLNDIARIRKNASKTHLESDTNFGTATSNGHSDDHESSNYDESKNASGKDLIIPEKSSSFSIHPGRLCSDVCNYCFGKFGCLDTPCHVAALKPERQKKILENELHLTAESCLCDKCYRHVDKKANFPSKTTSGGGSKSRVRPPTSSQCCIKDCQEQATNTVKKKWLVKLKKSITHKLDIDIDKPGTMYFPLCTQHHYWVDYFTVCGICRKRLNRNHLFSLGSETDRLNLMLAEDGIPARLSDKLFLCKLCRYYSNLRLKYSDPGSIPSGSQIFYRDYRRKILASLNLPVSDSEDEPIVKDEKKKSSTAKKISDSAVNSNGASASSKSDESVMALSNLATLLGDQPEQQARIQVKFGNVNIGRLSNLNIGQGGREERLPYSEVGLQANLEFEGPSVPDGSWERCVSTLQFDKRTKKLWQDLQKPYGSQSSFLRHLVMLEKYWRAGHLSLTSNADERAAKYLNGVRNRIKAFEGSPSGSGDKQPPASVPLAATPSPTISNTEKFPLITNTGEIEVTPISIQKRPAPSAISLSDKRPMTHLDRAKSLVRMVPPTQRHRFPMPLQRFQVPVYVPSHTYTPPPPRPRPPPQQHRPPPLMKIVSKGLPGVPFFTHQLPPLPPYSTLQAVQPLKPILPKLPSALTVTQVAQGGAAITLNRSGITIEKQSASTLPTPTLPMEKPSISVFREPAPGPP